jgi:transaldolase
MNPLRELNRYGQSLWLDYISRSLIMGGGLRRLVEDDGLTGVTSNPTLFAKAITEGTDYDDAINQVLRLNPSVSDHVLAERMMVEDVQLAAEVLRPVYDRTDGADGFVSIEVSPASAHDTAATVAEARHLWFEVARPNVMIKVPATRAGIPAIAMLIAQGINVNITLMFSLEHYEAVAHAYLRGLVNHPDPSSVSSVASVFVSRLDAVADRRLEQIGSADALALCGKTAIANARLIYRRFREIFYGDDFADLARRGARLQRPLWASTGTKNPAYSDVLYLESLIGPDTVTTVPPSTMDAFRDHGRLRHTLESADTVAEGVLQQLAAVGVDVHAITEQLQADGIDAFATSFDRLLASLAQKRRLMFTPDV